jgi:hypothetical protein
MNIDDITIPTEIDTSDSGGVDIQYPNLFTYDIANCKQTFPNLSLLIEQGFTPVKSVSDEIIGLFKLDELFLNLQVSQNVFVKELDYCKIMVVLSIAPSRVEFPDLLPTNNHPYYILAKVLLDKNDNLLKKLEYDLPSMTFYRKEGGISANRKIVILDSYYTFFDTHYAVTDIEEFDNYSSKYYFVFREYNHKMIATAVHCNSAIELISLKNSTFYMNGIVYNPDILFEIEGTVKGSDFRDYLDCRISMTQDKLDLLAMTMI